MTRCHCRGALSVSTDEFGRTMTRCTSCGALACVRRIPAEQIELMEAPTPGQAARRRSEERIHQRRGHCATIDCDNATEGRKRFCDDCRAARDAECKRRYYENQMRPAREQESVRVRRGWHPGTPRGPMTDTQRERISRGRRDQIARRQAAA